MNSGESARGHLLTLVLSKFRPIGDVLCESEAPTLAVSHTSCSCLSTSHRWGAPLRLPDGQDTPPSDPAAARLAFIKLSQSLDRTKQPDSQALRAALVCRLHLGIKCTSVGAGFVSELVARRMATALYVEQDRTSMDACYSIDPILAWAAVQIITCFRSDFILIELNKLTKTHLIKSETRGELITKFTVMTAYDRALWRRFGLDWSAVSYEAVCEIPHFSAVTLSELLANLSGRSDLLDALDTTNSVRLRALEDCSTVLAQWTGSMGGESAFNINLAVQAMLAHCGVQMPDDTPGIDHMLVFCKDEHLPVAPSNLVVMLFQTKIRSQFESVRAPQSLFDRFIREGVPVIFVLHEVDPQVQPFGVLNDDNWVSQIPSPRK